MSYNFTPLSDEELDAIDVIPEGTYNFEVISSIRKISKAGNPIAELQLKVWDNEGKIHNIFDYLVFSSINLNIRKISHFSKATGIYEEYKKGCIRDELHNLSGKAHIGIKDPQPKDGGGFYPKKNIVLDYIICEKVIEQNKNNLPPYEDVPF